MRNKLYLKFIIPVSLIVGGLLLLPGCEDDSIPKSEYIIGEWEVTEINDQSPNSYEVQVFKENGTYKWIPDYNDTTYYFKGNWEWEIKTEILNVAMQGDTSEWEIQRLTKSELWYKDEAGDEYKCEEN